MIVAADIHLKENSAYTVFNQVFPGLWSAVSQDADKTLAILGDVYHVRYRVSVSLQNRLFLFLEFLASQDIKVILLPGNHDQINPEGENALEVFRDLPNVKVYTHPTKDEWGLWIPYRKNPEDIQKVLQQPPIQGSVLWMHHGVHGAWMNDRLKNNSEGLPLSAFAHWYKVNCGHYHMRQIHENVTYIGSAYQTSANEHGQPKGYGIWNKETLEMSFVNANWGKKYHHVATVTGQLNLEGMDKKDEIRITVPADIDPEKLGKQLLADGYENIVVIPTTEVIEARLKVKHGTISEFAQAYIEEFHGHLDPARLLAAYGYITDEKPVGYFTF